MMLSLALIANAQPVPQGQRPNPTVGGAKPVGEAASRETVIQKCSRIEADAVYLIPETNYFHGRIEASGSGAYAYNSKRGCPYWVVDFLMNHLSHTWVNESGLRIKENVLFSGDAYDLPSSSGAGGIRPIVETDCRNLEIDVLVFEKDPNENIFRLISSGNGRFGSWNSGSKTCNINNLPGAVSRNAPNANLLKIRIAVRVKLRGSWQQAAGYALLAPPN